jgi:hypothetical protein
MAAPSARNHLQSPGAGVDPDGLFLDLELSSLGCGLDVTFPWPLSLVGLESPRGNPDCIDQPLSPSMIDTRMTLSMKFKGTDWCLYRHASTFDFGGSCEWNRCAFLQFFSRMRLAAYGDDNRLDLGLKEEPHRIFLVLISEMD